MFKNDACSNTCIPTSTVELKLWEEEEGVLGNIDTISNQRILKTEKGIFIIGGRVNGKISNSVVYAKDIGASKYENSKKQYDLPEALENFSVVGSGDYIFVIGGATVSGVSDKIYRSKIDEFEVLGEWKMVGTLPKPLANASIIKIDTTLLIVGGDDEESVSNQIYITTLLDNGTIGSVIAYAEMPLALTNCKLVLTKNKLYIMSGIKEDGFENEDIYSSLFTSKFGSLSTSFNKEGKIPCTFLGANLVYAANNVFVIGGIKNGRASALIYRAGIDTNGNIWSWYKGGSLPHPNANSTALITTNKLYLFGGYNDRDLSDTLICNFDGWL
jgi:N-acetylneuraminic acid mutarotase